MLSASNWRVYLPVKQPISLPTITSGSPKEPLPVVATFSILGDFVKNVGGDRVEVTTLVGPNGDVHVYEPTPSDARKLSVAKVVFVNGLGLEGWITRLITASGSKAPIIIATKGITPRDMMSKG
jgi:zinc/manganese transport system substrate-binding protein